MKGWARSYSICLFLPVCIIIEATYLGDIIMWVKHTIGVMKDRKDIEESKEVLFKIGLK